MSSMAGMSSDWAARSIAACATLDLVPLGVTRSVRPTNTDNGTAGTLRARQKGRLIAHAVFPLSRMMAGVLRDDSAHADGSSHVTSTGASVVPVLTASLDCPIWVVTVPVSDPYS